ncbi:MAG: response regulator [bacterium]
MSVKKKILVIEDNKEVCDLIEMILSEKYDVCPKTEITSVLNDFDVSIFDLIVTDFLMGGDSAETVVARYPNKTYLIVTALSTQNSQLNKLVKLPNVSYLQKPFEIHELIETVDSLVKST